jgi:hypothetical protein
MAKTMKIRLLLFLCFFVGVYVFPQKESVAMINKLSQQRQSVGSGVFTAGDYKPGLLKHIVLFKYKKKSRKHSEMR